MNIGANSRIVDGFSTRGGILTSSALDLVELSARDSRIINWDGINYQVLGQVMDAYSTVDSYISIHAPFVSSTSLVNLDLANTESERARFVMEQVFRIAGELNSGHVVIHAGVMSQGSMNRAISAIKSLAKLAEEYSVILLLENVHPFKRRREIGTLPQELLKTYHEVNDESLKLVLDIGHAFLSSKYYGFDVTEWFDLLSPYIYHMHIHDNHGLRDEHLPLGLGRIDFNGIIDAIKGTNAENIVLELKTDSGEEAERSIRILDGMLN